MVATTDLPLRTFATEFICNSNTGSGLEGPVRVGAADVAVQLAISAGRVAASWAILATYTGAYAGQRADVIGDLGSHTDPVVGGTVPNSGVFSWSTSPSGWRYVSSQSELSIIQAAQLAATNSATSSANSAISAANAATNAATAATNAGSAATYAATAALQASQAQAAIATVAGYASATGISKIYASYADAAADAAGIAANAWIQVLVDESHSNARTFYQKVGGSLVYKATIDQFLAPAASVGRNWATICAPNIGNDGFIDNVLAIQNASKGSGGTISGNAAINFLDRAGTERCAIGYSRNAALAPLGGYVGNTCYIEIGNPFTTDSSTTDFRLIQTIKAGGPYWGGAFVGYDVMNVTSSTGDVTFQTPGSGALSHQMTTTKARMRERFTGDQWSIATNIADMSSGGALTQDNAALASWEISVGAGRDRIDVFRYAAGSTLISAAQQILRIENTGRLLVNQNGTSAGADGTFSVTAHNAGYSAITAKNSTNTIPVLLCYNASTSGNASFAVFGTDASYAERGSITYNRSGGVVAYNTTSDERSKTVLGPITNAVSRLMQLNPIRARMNGAEVDIDAFVAHEVQAVVPEAVTGERGGEQMQQLDKTHLIPLLVAAVQEQQHRIDAIEGIAA